MAGAVTVFGAAYSVYVRIVRLTLEEKGVPYRLEEVDIFAEGGPPAEHRARHPFGRIPAFEHDGFRLFETAAIARYIDEAFDGPALMPRTPQARARVNQITGQLDSYGYRALVWDVFVERVRAPQEGRASDAAKIAVGLETAETVLATLDDLVNDTGGGPYLVGAALMLADLHAAPIVGYFRQAPVGAALLARHPQMARWWDRMAGRESVNVVVG